MNDSSHLSDEAWLSQVFREFERPLVAYATQLLRDPARAKDVVQDTFVRLCQQERHKVEASVRQWLFTVCRNRTMDVLKKERRMKTLQDEQAMACESPETDPQQQLEIRESAACVGTALAELTDKQQEVVRLKVQGGLSYREISAVTGMSISNVGYVLHTAIKTVRGRLAEVEA